MNGISLRKALLKNNFVLSDIAKRLGISPQAFNSRLKAKSLTVNTIKEIEEAIGVKISSLELKENLDEDNLQEFNPPEIAHEEAVEYRRQQSLQGKDSLNKMALAILDMYIKNDHYLLWSKDGGRVPVSDAPHQLIADNAYSQAVEMLKASEQWVRVA